MLRAGPFSDEWVIRLANRRFVPFYFDLSNRGVAGDPDAREFVVAQRKELGGRSVPTPPVLIMTPEGEVLGEVSNYASPAEVLKTMLRALDKHPEWAKPSEEERRNVKKPLLRAEVCLDLQDRAGALAALGQSPSDPARCLRGRIARLEGDWKAMARQLDRVKQEDLTDDVRMERAYEPWQEGDFKKLREQLAGFPESSNRYTEARYYEGLAHYHLGEVEQARAIWKATIKGCAQDPWIYRADWAYTDSAPRKGGGGRRVFSSGNTNRVSLLNRIGYMSRGRGNPDLAKR